MDKGRIYNSIEYWNKYFNIANYEIEQKNKVKDVVVKEYIINANILVNDKNINSTLWLSFNNPYAVLGFVQYVFLPTLSYHLLRENEELQMPLIDTAILCEHLAASDLQEKEDLIRIFEQLQELWLLPEVELQKAICQTVKCINGLKIEKSIIAQTLLFNDALQVFEHIKEYIWSEEVFQEDFGCSYDWLEHLCRAFPKSSFFQRRLLKFLNNKVGCLVS
ncbi:MAG TPA: hypothetical protein IAB06_04755 [Candidatus Avacidaminococcus intestinavium]|uniref:Uncharacterized protein n=1 Tax=Candidatus Avacidaminococcus intestinavium TaxID=2840684 RepID=A0A9D1MPZ9_9FIRM|nr:hypothetical protein [Candidatus Avacidaminococcus intestinavium]